MVTYSYDDRFLPSQNVLSDKVGWESNRMPLNRVVQLCRSSSAQEETSLGELFLLATIFAFAVWSQLRPWGPTARRCSSCLRRPQQQIFTTWQAHRREARALVQKSENLASESILWPVWLLFYFILKILLVCLFEKGVGRESITRRLSTEYRCPRGIWSNDPWIMTWAEINSWAPKGLIHPGIPQSMLFLLKYV